VCDSTTSTIISLERGRGRVLLYLSREKESLLSSWKLVCSGEEEIYNSMVAGARVEIRL